MEPAALSSHISVSALLLLSLLLSTLCKSQMVTAPNKHHPSVSLIKLIGMSHISIWILCINSLGNTFNWLGKNDKRPLYFYQLSLSSKCQALALNDSLFKYVLSIFYISQVRLGCVYRVLCTECICLDSKQFGQSVVMPGLSHNISQAPRETLSHFPTLSSATSQPLI